MRTKDKLVWAWVSPAIKEAVKKIAKAKGITLSEYVRNLILEDLEKRGIFNVALKPSER